MLNTQSDKLIKAIASGNSTAIETAKENSDKKVYTTHKDFFLDLWKSSAGGPPIENYELRFNEEEQKKKDAFEKLLNELTPTTDEHTTD